MLGKLLQRLVLILLLSICAYLLLDFIIPRVMESIDPKFDRGCYTSIDPFAGLAFVLLGMLPVMALR